MTSVTYTIPNISCMHCVKRITTQVSKLAGVKSVQADVETKRATIVFEPPATEEQIRALLTEIDYPPTD